jgi:Cft2 family RNA processing exonuclease
LFACSGLSLTIFRKWCPDKKNMIICLFACSGLSLTIFRKWCPDEKNMIIMPGYCVAGTVGMYQT